MSAAPAGRRYCLITPCRDEAAFIRTTLETTTSQTVPPARWVIVDDGSTDATPAILAEFAAEHDYITVVTRTDRGARAVGPGVIQAFEEGLAHVDLDDFDYVAKFDGDLELGPRYFERSMERMEADPWLGNVSGKLYQRRSDGRLVQERTGDENAVGPVKFYRVECFRDIGGFVPQVCWDGIDGHVARLKGWVAMSVDDPDMQIVHLRQMGSSDRSIYRGRVRWGGGKHYMGSAWYFVLVAAVYRMAERPYVLGGLSILWGYLRAALRGQPRHPDPDYLRYLRRFERRQLLKGKSAAAEEENARVRAAHPERARR